MCSYHGSAPCACQFVVLLAYPTGPAREGATDLPVVVTVRSRGAGACAQIVRDEATCPDRRLVARAQAALAEAEAAWRVAAEAEARGDVF